MCHKRYALKQVIGFQPSRRYFDDIKNVCLRGIAAVFFLHTKKLLAFAATLLTTYALIQPGQARADCTIRVGWDEWPPYITYKNTSFQGLEYELLKSTADSAGCQLDMVQVPWARALIMLSDRNIDLLYGAGYSEERAKFAKYSVPYRQEQFVLVTHGTDAGTSQTISLKDWIRVGGSHPSKRALGVFRGTFYGQQIDQIFKTSASRIALVELSQNEQMVEMLKSGRLSGFLVEDGVAQMMMKEPAFPMKRFLIEEQLADPLHYMFSFDVADEIIQRFNTAIQSRQSVNK